MQVGLTNLADRVNLGLIPSSEEGWPLACAALKRSTGGWLHIHGNVTTKSDERRSDCQDDQKYSHLLTVKYLKCSLVTEWIGYVLKEVLTFLQRGDSSRWSVEARHVEHVKSYAPHIHHLVLDLECRPTN